MSDSPFRSSVLAFEAAAKRGGITLSMSKLRDAIAVALVGRPYAAAMAAEAAGMLPALILPPPHLVDACQRYGLDADRFAQAFGTQTEAAEPDGLTLALDKLVESPAPLWRQYRSQHAPQPAYVEMTEDGRVTADCSGEIGNARPAHVWHEVVMRFACPPAVSGAALYDYLRGEGRALLARIHAGHGVSWRDTNQVGELSADAQQAKVELEAALAELEQVNISSAITWLASAPLEDVWTECRTLAQVIQAVQDAAQSEGVVLDGDIEDALLQLAMRDFEHDGRLPRAAVRALVQDDRIPAESYVDWLCETAPDAVLTVEQAGMDREVGLTLSIEDSGASTEEITAGVVAALESLTASGVSPFQAYAATRLEAEGRPFVADHSLAWHDAESVAFAAAFRGWARMPEAACLCMG